MHRLFSLMALLGLLAGLLYALPASAATTPWAPNTAYATGAKVTYNGQVYECIQGHTSLSGWEPPNVPALWKVSADTTPTNTTGPTNTPTKTATAGPTNTPTKTATTGPTNTPTKTATTGPTNTPTKTATPGPTNTPTTTCPTWAPGLAVTVGLAVVYNGQSYTARIAHTAQAGWEPTNATTLWAVGGNCGGPGVPTATPGPGTHYCAKPWVSTKIYSKGNIVAYQGGAYEALVDTHAIPPNDPVYTGQWKLVGVPDDELCPVSIPNTINYGVAQPAQGNQNAGNVRPAGAIGAARISNTASTLSGTRGGIDPSTDPGGNHGGLDADSGARVSKLAPGTLPLQHNTYALAAGTEAVAYLGDWAIYGRRFDFSKLPVKNLNRLVYGFAGICFPGAHNTQDPGFPTTAPAAVNRTCSQSHLPDGAMALADFEAAFVRNLPGGQTPKIVGTESMYDISKDDVGGVFGVLYTLRRANPHLKLNLSVGGWTLSEGFPWMASDPARRKAFVDSVVSFLQRYDFDGIDIDWEYPGSDGAVVGMARPDDPQNYLQLIKDLRAGLDWLTVKTGKHYHLSSAIPATQGKLDKINWTEVGKYLDRLYVMTYDLTGAWERNISHHAPLNNNPNANGSSTGTSASWAMDYLRAHGVPANKLMIGVANYHRSKAIRPGDITEYTSGLKGNTSFGDPNWTGAQFILGIAGVGSWEAGVVEGYDFYQNFLDRDIKPRNGYHLYTDKASNADYLVQPTIGSYISIETPRTAALKAQYAKANGLAGVFFWQIEQDNGYNLNAVNHVLGNTLASDIADGKPQNQIPTCGENVTVAECESLIQSLR